jgi:site-specific DNA-methyltransferase (adenine-specific)
MLLKGNCLTLLAEMPDNSVESVVTDPPYELAFMNKGWDSTGIAYNVELWSQVLRVLKPGGYLLAFGGSRTYHRLASAVEDAGFEIRDQIMWIYSSGFPKSLNLKGEFEGWGTALKPAHEPIVVARKPLNGTVLKNVSEHGTGAINIGESRIGERWPANVIHDGINEDWSKYFYCAKASQSERNAGLKNLPMIEIAGKGNGLERTCDLCGKKTIGGGAKKMGGCECPERTYSNPKHQNFHPTIKPLSLMRYLVKLVTPKNGTVLDLFLGSGTTAVAAILEGFNWIGCEMTEDYWPIIEARVAWAESDYAKKINEQKSLF